jgi:hypothetical protein
VTVYDPGAPEAGGIPPRAETARPPLDLARPPYPFAVFPSPAERREPLHRRALALLGTCWQWFEVLVDRLVSAPLNPL